MAHLLVLFALVLMASSASASVIYVDADAQGAATGASWEHAFPDLQDALASASYGDEIWIAAGTYFPTQTTDWLISFNFVSGVGVYGGFAGGELNRDERNWTENESILSGDIQTPEGVWYTASEFVVRCTDLDSTTVISGVTISDGTAGLLINGGAPRFDHVRIANNRTPGGYGEGIGARIENGSRPTFHKSEFTNNVSWAYMGGGIWVSHDSYVTLQHVLIEGNSCYGMGAGMYGTGRLDYVTFRSNRCDGYGAGMAIHGTTAPAMAVITNSTFVSNLCGTGGGGASIYWPVAMTNVHFLENEVYNGSIGGGGYYGSGTLVNVLFDRNSAPNGGGLHSWMGGLTLVNALFVGNKGWVGGASLLIGDMPRWWGEEDLVRPLSTLINVAFVSQEVVSPQIFPELSGAAVVTRRGDVRMLNSIVWGIEGATETAPSIFASEANVEIGNSIVQGSGGSGPTWVEGIGSDLGGNLDADARFVDPAAGDYRLRHDSPGVDTGRISDFPASVTTDLNGDARIVGAAIDMGPFESDWPVSIQPVGAVPSTSTPHLSAAPNPFNPSTVISYGIPRAGWVNLIVYDIAGRRVRSLVTGFRDPGDYGIRWDGRDDQSRRVATGVYLCRLQGEDFRKTHRVLLVK